MDNNENVLINVVGKIGTGMSSAALHIAEEMCDKVEPRSKKMAVDFGLTYGEGKVQ